MIPAIIPARGGSKGIPRKNLVEVCGRPLIVWSIDQALQSSAVDVVIVTTDDQEIGRVAMEHGAAVFWRHPATATDTASSESALAEVIESAYADSEAVVFLQATSPIRQPGDIDACVEMVTSGKVDSVFSARHIEGYVWRTAEQLCYPTHAKRVPRQMQTVCNIEENGSIYAFLPEVLLQGGSRHARDGRIAPYLMHPLDSFQIDEPADIPLVEQLMELRCGRYATRASR